MAALNFPTAPIDGQLYQAPNGITYKWDAANGVWLQWGTGANNSIISSSPPLNPTAGQQWWSAELGQLFIFYVDINSSQWVPACPSATLLTPPGLISDFGGPLAPAGWYLCDGSLKNRSTDAPLFAAIGTAHGAGDGASTFALPDLRGRVTAGPDPTNVRLGNGPAGGFANNGAVLGAASGEAAHVSTVAEMPAHNHDMSDPQHSHAIQGGYMNANAAGPGIFNTANTGPQGVWQNTASTGSATGITSLNRGGGAGHNIVQPTLICTKIIKR
jgi:microcystin-dependent protein